MGLRAGTITIATSEFEYDAPDLPSAWIQSPPAPGRYVELSVTDTGSGISPDVLLRIFDPFFTTKFVGRGLGLPAVLGIVQGHHGAIRVESAPGSGTRVRLVLPVSGQRSKPPARRAPTGTEWRGKGTVLFVDDEEQVRNIGKIMMERMGLDVVLAGDGDEAIEIVRGRPDVFDCVVLDLTMPGKDGIETLASLRRIRGGSSIVFTSGYTADDVLSRLQGTHYDAFLQKPFDYVALQTVLQRVLAK
jgi:CheY-like chemotaxis protein